MLNLTKEHIEQFKLNLVNELPKDASPQAKAIHKIFVLGKLLEVVNSEYKQANLEAKKILGTLPKSENNLGKVIHYGYYDVIAHGRGSNEPVVEICPLTDEEAQTYMDK